MGNWSFERIEMPEIGVLRYNLSGIETNTETSKAQVLLCDRLKREPQWTGVLFDYSDSELSYSLAEFSDRIAYVVKNMPRRVKLAYVFSSRSFVVAARASKLLSSSGIKTQAFSNAEEALSFLTGDESWSRQAKA